ncbi:MAG TPA: TetR/AcrR family transcriptional regulator [Rhizomicrobium sp.]|nr:TetR/AcrR family transcriptional regulator [Rhizomicrobium sp.]
MDLAEAKKITPDARRNAILDIAHAAFMRDGYAGASMSRIAAELGGSKTTLYNYFASKKELFVAVAERECASLFDQLFAFDESVGDFRLAMRDLAKRILTEMLSDRLVNGYRLIVAESARFPEVGQAANEIALEQGLARLSAYFRRAIEAGQMRQADPKLAAEQFFDLACGHLHKQRLWNVLSRVTADQIEEEAERVTGTFLAAFGNEEISRAARQFAGD